MSDEVLIDPNRMLNVIRGLLDTETNPTRRRNLETLIAHMMAETLEPDLEVLMATVAPEPAYHSWGAAPYDAAPKGRDGVTKHYAEFHANVGNAVEFFIERMAMSDTLLAIDGTVRRVFPGGGLALGDAAGVSVDRSQLDDDGFYLWETRMAVFFEFDDDGLVLAEDTYATGGDAQHFRRLDDDEVPQSLRERACGSRTTVLSRSSDGR